MAARIKTLDPKVDRALDGVHPTLSKLNSHPLANGVFVEATLSAGVDYRIAHGLKRAFQGWVLVDTTGTSPVYRGRAGNNATEIWLTSAAATSIKVYVF